MKLTRQTITPKILADIIKKDINSIEKQKMRESVEYYNFKNKTILNRKKMMILYGEEEIRNEETGTITKENYDYLREDFSKANHKMAHGYHYELVNQCKNYLCGKPIKVSYKENVQEKSKEIIDDTLNKDNYWAIFNQTNVKNCQIFGRAWFRPLINDNILKFISYNPLEIIPFYNDFDELDLLIRYYEVEEYDEKNKLVKIKYAEVYDNKIKDVYIAKKNEYVKDKSEALVKVITTYGETSDEEVEEENPEENALELPFVPFVEWKFNEERTNALEPIKAFINMLDIDLSDLANNVDDIQDVVWILENYQGQNLTEFMHDLKVKKAIKVGEGGGVDTKEINIPTEARMKLYEACERNIYRFGFGIDFSKRENLGNVSGVALKWSYAPLDQKADEIENQGQIALNKLFSLIFFYKKLELDSNDIEFIFDRTMISNEVEKANMVMSASTLVSKKTALENHPLVDDVDEEIDRLDEEDEYNGNQEGQGTDEVDEAITQGKGEKPNTKPKVTVSVNNKQDNYF